MRMTGAAGPSVMTDLEALAELDLDPDYVLAFIPARLYERIRDRLVLPGWWELLSVADYNAGNPACDAWTWEVPRRTPATDLAAWAASLLGYSVALEAGTAALKASGTLRRWHDEPVYWVRRDT